METKIEFQGRSRRTIIRTITNGIYQKRVIEYYNGSIEVFFLKNYSTMLFKHIEKKEIKISYKLNNQLN